MKTISISTATYAAIWNARRDGEETEDQILSRLLVAEQTPARQVPLPKPTLQQRRPVKPAQVSKPAATEETSDKDSHKFTTTDLDLLS